jgi:NitT/TauT family transport system substrate-binding protein
VYAHDQGSGLKLLAGDAWFVVDGSGKDVSAYLLKADAQTQAAKVKGKVVDFDTLTNFAVIPAQAGIQALRP